MSDESNTLTFDDLTPYLLLKNGNFLYKVPFRGGWAVLKVYYGSRSPFSRVIKSLENIVLAGQTSYMPKTRRRIESECLDLWRQHGFRVFGTYPEIKVKAPNCPDEGYMLFEYVEAPKLDAWLRDESKPLEERLDTFREFLRQWGRRHEIAIREKEPRLVHENGDGKHVLIMENELLWFDFEMIFRSRRAVPLHVSHEIIQYLWYLNKNTPEDVRTVLFEETVKHYPDRDRLVKAYEFFWEHPNPIHRWGRAADRALKKKQRRPTSKYSVARRLKETLDRTQS